MTPIDIDLARAALTPALIEYPDLDADSCLAQISALAEDVSRATPAGGRPSELLPAINHRLFVELGFRGNEQDYFDPRNSFLNDVLDRRTGIPITLSVLYIAVARRLGLRAYGVGFPFHFLVKVEHGGGELLVDPYHGGEFLTRQDCEKLVRKITSRDARLLESDFATVDNRYIVTRILTNLKVIYANNGQWAKAIKVLHQLVAANPRSADLIRERGLLHFESGQHQRAAEDLEAYLQLAPAAEDREQIRGWITALKKTLAMMN